MDAPSTDVTIEVPGQKPVHTTTEAIKKAADRAEQRAKASSAKASSDKASRNKAASNTGTAAGPAAFAKDQLKSIIERIERLEEEKKGISDDIADIYSEAKGNGFDVKALRTIVRMRKQDPSQRAEEETILETYMVALGML